MDSATRSGEANGDGMAQGGVAARQCLVHGAL